MVKIVSSQKAKNLARDYRPVFVQEFKSPLDLIGGINFGAYITPEEPEIYFAVKENDTHYYIYYLVYHYRDYSLLPPPIKALDEHRHDFEGVMLAVDKKSKDISWGVSRSHYRLKVYDEWSLMPGPHSRPWFIIELGGHGIQSITGHDSNYNCDENRIIYKNYILINFYQKNIYKWFMTSVHTEFKKAGVDMPWEWNDKKISQKFGPTSTGLIWTDPDDFLKLARKCKLV